MLKGHDIDSKQDFASSLHFFLWSKLEPPVSYARVLRRHVNLKLTHNHIQFLPHRMFLDGCDRHPEHLQLRCIHLKNYLIFDLPCLITRSCPSLHTVELD